MFLHKSAYIHASDKSAYFTAGKQIKSMSQLCLVSYHVIHSVSETTLKTSVREDISKHCC